MKTIKSNFLVRNLAIATPIFSLGLFIVKPAFAHHPLDGRLPANFFEGIMSGFGHPILGFDHLAFVIASGLMALSLAGEIMIPIAFVIATAIGAGIHLQSVDLPIPEIIIATSVVLFGVLLIVSNYSQKMSNYSVIVAFLAIFAGIFHGHAYGEGIFGAEPTPLVAYLIGFTIIQLVIALGVYGITQQLIKSIPVKYITRFGGFAIAAIGMVFLSSAITG